MKSILQPILARVGAFIFGTSALFFGLATLSMIIAMATRSDEKLTIVEIVFAIALTLLSWWLMRLCWRKRTPSASDQPPKPPRAKRPAPPETIEFYSKVVGTSYRNRNGTSRQAAIRKDCSTFDPLDLIREPDNKHDRHAIAVFCDDKQIGYLSADIAGKYAPKLDAGLISMKAYVEEVTGGDGDKSTLGVNINIKITPTS